MVRLSPQPAAPHGSRDGVKPHTKIVLGLVLGAVCGVTANALAPDAAWVRWIGDNVAGPVGQVFLRLLLMTVIPLVFTSIALGVAGIGDIRKVGRVGIRTLVYFLLSTALSAAIGLGLVNLFQPGAGLPADVREQLMTTYRAQAQGLQAAGTTHFGIDTFVNMVPRNPIQAAAGMDLLGVIFFSLVFGAALTLIPEERARPLVRVLDAVGEAIVKIIDLAMKLAPYGVFGLIFFTTSRFGWGLLRQLGLYVAIVLAGLLVHGAVSLSLLVRVFGGLRPAVFWSRIRASVVTAFSTSSSNATLPTNIAVAEEELGIPPKIAGFVLPLGSTMCMNGTALYEGVTVLFLAQVFGVSLSLGTQVVVLVLSVITAVGAAGVPGGSLPLLMVVLATVGVPPEGIAIILGVDRILDMCRTTINVCGDLTAAVYVARAEGEWDPRAVTREPARLQVA
ncbi:MAG: dicarboxylate/amino acid:cation symporter [Gemmatimonadetes bacterium]|nr:MAG: dicarboxylate/amino acid:cation symporter [Gemmatimonadota bacterium]